MSDEERKKRQQYPVVRHFSQEDIDKACAAAQGRDSSAIHDLKEDLPVEFNNCIACPITNGRWKQRWRSMFSTQTDNVLGELDLSEEERKAKFREIEVSGERWRAATAFLEDECNLTQLYEAQHVIGLAADWLELDSVDDWVRHDCELALKQEIAYANYLGLQTIVAHPPMNPAQAIDYGRALRSCLDTAPYMHIAVRVPLYDPAVFKKSQRGSSALDMSLSPLSAGSPRLMTVPGSPMQAMNRPRAFTLKASESEYSGTWEMWDTIRAVCDYHPRLHLALDLSLPLPPIEIVSRWTAEPISFVFLPAAGFIPNPKEYPVLPKGNQSFIQKLMRTRPQIILYGNNPRAASNAKFSDLNLVKYLFYLEKSADHTLKRKNRNSIENYGMGYEDLLQVPLQPLQDHLASAVYENFERDPVKYQKYEEAIYQAIIDRPGDGPLVLTVAGAGRGPLVNRALKAIARSKRRVEVYAIEKNPSAFVTLQQLKRTLWQEFVTILFGDMRKLDVPEKADILVSELLGSFGDNELSPECLDGAMRFLKEDGISIPASYESYLAPIQSTRLWAEAGGTRATRDAEREKGLEMCYVVMLQNINFLAEDSPGYLHGDRCGGRIQKCWEFLHPRAEAVLDEHGLPLTNTHNVRSASLTFAIPHAGVLHGFAGYFEAVLYKNIGLSIHPERKEYVSKDMLSWFPCYFPVKEPLYLPSNAELRVSIWRLTGAGRVWYEWLAESFLPVSFSPTPAPAPAAAPLSPSPSPQQPAAIPGSANTSFASVASGAGSVSMSMSGAGVGGRPGSPRVDGAGTVFMPSAGVLSASPGPRARSPLLDAVVGSPLMPEFAPVTVEGGEGGGFGAGVVKIGQTGLHNAGGRSSYYGL